MEIVINIPEEDFEHIELVAEMQKEEAGLLLIPHSYKFIANGTPLPKGHGDLIDRSKLNITDLSPDPWYSPLLGYSEWEIDDADVVVEADKGVEDGDSN